MRNFCGEDNQTRQDWLTVHTYMYIFIQHIFTNIYKVNGLHWMHLVKMRAIGHIIKHIQFTNIQWLKGMKT